MTMAVSTVVATCSLVASDRLSIGTQCLHKPIINMKLVAIDTV
jgi:hypothetical protein